MGRAHFQLPFWEWSTWRSPWQSSGMSLKIVTWTPFGNCHHSTGPNVDEWTLPFNLDPFGDHNDYKFNDALQKAGVNDDHLNMNEESSESSNLITLDIVFIAGGSNLSQGQKQRFLPYHRPLRVRRPKIILLDEETASVDWPMLHFFRKPSLIFKIQHLDCSTSSWHCEGICRTYGAWCWHFARL